MSDFKAPRSDLPEAVYSRIAGFLGQCGLGRSELLSHLGIQAISDLGKVQWAKARLEQLPAATSIAVRLFLQGAAVSRQELDRVLDPELLACLAQAGLISRVPDQDDLWQCPVMLYPIAGWWAASDRVLDIAGRPIQMGSDAVFPALYPGTIRFLRLMPATTGSLLDVCGGCGIGAMAAAPTARSVVTSDLTERSHQFALFNFRLNGVKRARSIAAGGYHGVPGELFDVIVGHPPYVPSLGDGAVFRDGGSLGEDVIRELVTHLPEHLGTNGQAMFLSFGRSTHEIPWEQRVREWLGRHSAGFDLVLAVFDRKSPKAIAVDLAERHGQGRPDAARELEGHFDRHHTREFIYGPLYFARTPEGSEPVTEVVEMASQTAGAVDLAERLAWARCRARPDHEAILAAWRPELRSGLELHTRHRFQDGTVEIAECLLRVEAPIPGNLRIDPGMVPVLALMDGQRTTLEVLEQSVRSGEVPASVTPGEWLGFVRNLVDRGILRFGSGTAPASSSHGSEMAADGERTASVAEPEPAARKSNGTSSNLTPEYPELQP